MKSTSLFVFGFAGICCAATLRAAEPAPTPNREVEEQPLLKGPNNLPDTPVKRTKGTIGTLLTVHNLSGPELGKFVRISVTRLPGTAGTPDSLGYDKFLGPLTMKSLGAVMEAVGTLEHGWPRGGNLQLAFSEKPVPVELNPATLADALLLDSILRDWDPEPNLAVIGTIGPDGAVEPVQGIPVRLSAAAQARVGRIIVPAKNYQQVADFLLSQGIASFVGTQIFTAETFNDAGVLSVNQLEGDTKAAYDLFGAVQRTLLASGAGAVPLLRNERVQGTLQQVLAKAPNHLSAKVLYEWGTGQRAIMSLDGSVDAIDRFAADLIRSLRAKPNDALAIQKPALTNNVANLRFIHDRLDPRARGYAEALQKYGDVLQKAVGSATTAPKGISGTLRKDFDGARQLGNDEWSKMAQARMDAPEKK